MVQQIDLRRLKQEAQDLVRNAQVSPKGMIVLYLGLILIMDMASALSGDVQFLSTFLSILTTLLANVLSAGFILYCMAIRRGERCEYLTLFDGFSFVGKIILLSLLIQCITSLWAMLFIIPGIIAHYRYRFALLNLYENPELGILDAMQLSSRQTYGYKFQLFRLDVSYLGWSILASVPSIIYDGIIFNEATRQAMDFMQSPGGVLPVIDPSVTVLPGWAWILISGLWSLIVALVYLPQRRCVEVAFYEIAKSNSAEPTTPSLPE